MLRTIMASHPVIITILASHCDRCRNIQPASGSVKQAISNSGQSWGQIMLTPAPSRNILRRAVMMWRKGLSKVPIWSHWGMFSMGVANPERMTDGIMKTKEPRSACCMVMDRDDTSSPTPTIVMIKHPRARTRVKTDPRNGTPNQ